MSRNASRRLPALAAVLAALTLPGAATTATAAPAEPSVAVSASARAVAKGSATADFAAAPGPFDVRRSTVLGDCRGLVGTLAKLAAWAPDLQCSAAFPYGFASRVSQAVYYPQDAGTEPLPVINFVGGILSNDGHYDTMLRHWASQGFVVVASNDFVNTSPAMHVSGLHELTRLDADPDSPLHGRVDLSRTILAGHSAGGGATLNVSGFSAEQLEIIDPRIRVIGSMPIEPGPLTNASAVQAPTLVLTGAQDLVVPPWSWPLQQFGAITQAPAWKATADTADHFSPMQPDLARNEFAGITTAFIRYLALGDPAAAAYFVGPDYRLAQDEQFARPDGSKQQVSRNSLADDLG